jgi:secreted trypsin-like serine protease
MSLRRLTLPLAALALSAAPAAAHAGFWNYIIGGAPETGYPAVGAFLEEGRWFCTGTVIAPNVVLTAAHCLSEYQSAAGLEFFLGSDANEPDSGRRIALASLHVHPDYAQTDNADIAIAILSEDADVTPMPVRLEALDDSVVGERATFVGFGFTVRDVSGGVKYAADIPLSVINEYFVGYNTPGVNTCQGDSGGPAFLDFGNGETVIGVTSYGDALCEADGYNTRTDVFADFVSAFLDGSGQGDEAATEGGQIPIEPGTEPTDLDFCDLMGWYGDGVCDEDCDAPDPDCAEGAGDTDGEDEEDDFEDEGCSSGGLSPLAGLLFAACVRRRR